MVTLNSRGLLALTLPDNLEQPLLALQHRLFGELGLVSAMALPPLIPLLWTPEPLPLELLRGVARATPLALGLPGAGPSIVEGEVVVPVTIASGRRMSAEPELLQLLRETARTHASEYAGTSRREVAGLFPLLPGIRVASDESAPVEGPLGGLDDSVEAAPESFGELPLGIESEALSISSFELTFEEETAWWRHLRFREMARKRVTTRQRG